MNKLIQMIKGLSFAEQFGPSNVKFGKPLSLNHDLYEYFEKGYPDRKRAVEVIVKRFALRNVRILSVASGVGMDEILFAQQGNTVECIEPDEASVAVFRHFIKKLGIDQGKIVINQMGNQDFKSQNKFDFIYSSSPTDWMASDFRQAIPNHWIDFLNRFGSSKCTAVIKLYSTCYVREVLISSWLPKAIAHKLSELSNFRLKEYWLKYDGRGAVIIATNFNEPLPIANDFEDIFPDVKSFSKPFSNDYSIIDTCGPYFIVGKHLARRLLRKVLGRDLLNNW